MKRRVLLLCLLWCAAGACSSEGPPATPSPPEEAQCAEASERLGALACLHRLRDARDWEQIGVRVEAIDQVRSAKYMLPLRDDARLLPLFINAHRFTLHYDFLVEAFGDLFAGLTPRQYLDLLFAEGQREYYVGSLTEWRLPDGKTRFGFTLADDPKQPELFGCDDLKRVHAGLSERVYAGELAAVPSDRKQLAWFSECGLPVIDPTQTVAYEAYQRGVGFGTVRRYTALDLPGAIAQAEFGFEDILVLDETPSDVETVVSGAITGTRQGPLSHLAVRSAARGTPNCYVQGAYALMQEWEGKLVRVECAADRLLVREASLDEARAFWEGLRPPSVAIPEPDREHRDLVGLTEVALSTAEERALAVRRYGAKGVNLAWLRQTLDPALTPTGFLIPVAHYLAFMEANGWQVDLGSGPAQHTFAETLDHWLRDQAFLTDRKLRRERLLALQEAMKDAPCDATLMATLTERIPQVFGSAELTVRFRSSSNAEDGAFFNGAGLYDSYSGCLADDLDDDEAGPSHCDPHEPKERGVCRALRRVWASLWNPRAYDERAFYGVDQRKAAMAVLVNERSEQERANMVAFSGNPVAKHDARYLVNAQIDELPVVSPEPGMWPEQDLLTVVDGEVSHIERASGSSELPSGQYVLSDAELRELGAHLAKLAALYPYDATPPEGRAFLLDTEWKVMPDGSLRIKQVRPFLTR